VDPSDEEEEKPDADILNQPPVIFTTDYYGLAINIE